MTVDAARSRERTVVLRILADEYFNRDIVNVVLRRLPEAQIDTVQDVDLGSTDDPRLLDWAATRGRILLTHDVNTITRFANDRVRAGQSMPGVFAVPLTAPIKRVIDDVVLLLECSEAGEWQNQVRFLPL